MTNNEVITPENPEVKLVIREYDSGRVQVVVKFKIPTESGDEHQTKLLSKISLTNVKNLPFFEVGGKGGIILGKVEFCESLKNICKELGITIKTLLVRTVSKDSGSPNRIILTQSLDGIDKESPEWEDTLVKQAKMVVELLDGDLLQF